MLPVLSVETLKINVAEAKQACLSPDGDGEADGETDVHGLSVILPHTPGLEGEQDNDEDEEDNVEQAKHAREAAGVSAEHEGKRDSRVEVGA